MQTTITNQTQSIPQASFIEQSQWGQSTNNGTAYDSISNTTRKALVKLVTEQNLSVRKASKILKIKYTTAKALVQKYRISGNIDRQRARRMTFEDDQRERFRKDLIKKLPIEVEDESDDELKWGTAGHNLQSVSVLGGGMVANQNTTSTVSQVAQLHQVQQRFGYQATPHSAIPQNVQLYTWPQTFVQYRNPTPIYHNLFGSLNQHDFRENNSQAQDQISFDFGFYSNKILASYDRKQMGTQQLNIQNKEISSHQRQ